MLTPEPITGHGSRVAGIKPTSGGPRAVPRPAASALRENLLEVQILGPHPGATESEAVGVGLGRLHFLNYISLAIISIITMV